MIIVRVSGGLGNQFFQLALYNNLKEEFPTEEIMIDISFYEDQNSLLYWLYRKSRKIPNRKFMFKEQFNDEILNKIDLLRKICKNKLKMRILIFLNYLIPLKTIFKLTNINIINENNFDHSRKKEKVRIYDGYWQNIRYIQNQEYFIKKVLKEKFNNEFEEEKTNNLVLHIRRGDQATALSSNIYTILDLEYYERAINYIKLNEESFNEVTICSDDILWCTKNIKKIAGVDKINYSNSSSMIEDFLLMYNAKYLISSNSTFSWWAGFLGNSEKCLIPKRWYTFSPSNFINESSKIIEIN